MNISSQIRHFLTAAAAVVATALTAWFTLGPDEQAAMTEALGKINDGLVILIGVLATAGVRWLIGWAGKYLSHGNTSGGPGGLPLWVMIGTMAGMLGALPSCSVDGSLPVTGTVYYRDPGTGAKAGLTFSPGQNPSASIRVPVYDSATGDLIGMADLSADLPTVEQTSGK